MPSNLEVKATCADIDAAERTACSIGAGYQGVLVQTDTYFRVQHGRLKLREFGDGSSELIGYDRVEESASRISRFETFAAVRPDDLKKLLALVLGIRAVVRKTRKLYMYRGSRIHIDIVDNLGTFIEFEVPGDDPAGKPEEILAFLIKSFGIREADIRKHSYVDMITAEFKGDT